ncbi:hypothetical protein AVEN_258580-1, partial [Araneus ventricosus]
EYDICLAQYSQQMALAPINQNQTKPNQFLHLHFIKLTTF